MKRREVAVYVVLGILSTLLAIAGCLYPSWLTPPPQDHYVDVRIGFWAYCYKWNHGPVNDSIASVATDISPALSLSSLEFPSSTDGVFGAASTFTPNSLSDVPNVSELNFSTVPRIMNFQYSDWNCSTYSILETNSNAWLAAAVFSVVACPFFVFLAIPRFFKLSVWLPLWISASVLEILSVTLVASGRQFCIPITIGDEPTKQLCSVPNTELGISPYYSILSIVIPLFTHIFSSMVQYRGVSLTVAGLARCLLCCCGAGSRRRSHLLSSGSGHNIYNHGGNSNNNSNNNGDMYDQSLLDPADDPSQPLLGPSSRGTQKVSWNPVRQVSSSDSSSFFLGSSSTVGGMGISQNRDRSVYDELSGVIAEASRAGSPNRWSTDRDRDRGSGGPLRPKSSGQALVVISDV